MFIRSFIPLPNSNLTNIKSVKLFGDGIIHKCASFTDFSLSDSVFNYDFIIVKWAWAGINNTKSEIMLTKGITVSDSVNTIMFYSNGELTTLTSMPIAVGKIIINGSTISARFNANKTEWQTGLVEVVGFKL